MVCATLDVVVRLVMVMVVGEGGCSPDGGQATARGGRGGPSAQFARRSADEDVVSRGVEHPVVAFARVVVVTGHLDEALVEGEVVSNGVLPALLVLAIVREVADDELVDAVQRQPLLWAAANCHHDHRVVTVGGLLRSTPPSSSSTTPTPLLAAARRSWRLRFTLLDPCGRR